jgi:hypothetical protein
MTFIAPEVVAVFEDELGRGPSSSIATMTPREIALFPVAATGILFWYGHQDVLNTTAKPPAFSDDFDSHMILASRVQKMLEFPIGQKERRDIRKKYVEYRQSLIDAMSPDEDPEDIKRETDRLKTEKILFDD